MKPLGDLLRQKKVPELKIIAEELDIQGRSRLNKDELIGKLLEVDKVKLARACKFTWWDKHRNAVFGWASVVGLGVGVLGVVLAVGPPRPTPNPASNESSEHLEDLSYCSVLAVETNGPGFGFAADVLSVWQGRVDTVTTTSSDEFLDALLKYGHGIVHLSAGFDTKQVWFGAGDVISMERFKQMFLASDGNTRLLVLDGCASYAIGEVLKESRIDYLVVALPKAAAAEEFFGSFYSHLGNGCEPKKSFDLAFAEAEVRHEHAGEDFYFTSYR